MRWNATIYYRTDNGLLDNEVQFEEICDLDEYIEAGPHWGAIDRIEIKYAASDNKLTVEQSEQL